MDTFHVLPLKLRARWQVAVAVFLIVVIASFAGSMIVYKLLLQAQKTRGDESTMNDLKSPSTSSQAPTSAGGAPDLAHGVTKASEEPARKALFEKLAVDDARLDKLEEQRTRLANISASASPALPLQPYVSPTANDVRAQLTSALVHLLKLEKTEDFDNPEIVAVREEITRLQGQMAQASAHPSSRIRKRPLIRTNNEIKLEQIDAEITQCGAQIIADMQELAQNPSIGTKVESANRALEAPMNAGLPTPAGNKTSFFTICLIATMSVTFGIVVSRLAVIFLGRRDDAIRDEATLRKMLIPSAECIGSIPRMET
jgi:hypothetical protein